MFQVEVKDRGPAISVISSNITAATALSSISLVLSSVIGAWIGSSSTANIFTSRYIYGSRSSSMVYIKYISLLSCFLVAFACFVQTARYFVHANFLISMPNNDIPVGVIGGNISAATSFASVSLALSSLIGAWIGNAYHNESISSRIYGNSSATIVYLKYISILSCFMIAFACFVQTARCLVHANFLISMPNCEMPVSNVENAVIRGSNFWVVGLRSLYFATNLLLWIFGPIPMFVSSVITVVLLHNLDRNTAPLPQYDPPPVCCYGAPSDKEMTAVIGNPQRPEESQESRNGK